MTQTITEAKTGTPCKESGRYRFDRYVDESTQPAPKPDEREIPLSQGERFPPIRSCEKACYWKLVQSI